MAYLRLHDVTLCAAASVNVAATVAAMKASLDQVEFADCLLFTDKEFPSLDPRIRWMSIAPLKSGADYSEFLLRRLSDFVMTPQCLIVQWDGFVLSPDAWKPEFLDCDYIGAPWPQFADGHDVGNGGFSLRSRKLLDACKDADFKAGHPEDVVICRTNRSLLEDKYGIRFAEAALADSFAFERRRPVGPTFGFHGVFNLIPVLGPDRFWEIYRSLDDRTTAFMDYSLLMRQLCADRPAWPRRLHLTLDWLLRR